MSIVFHKGNTPGVPLVLPASATPSEGAVLYVADTADPTTPDDGEASVNIVRTLTDPAHDTTAIGFQASIQNNGADIATTAHHIAGFGVAQDTAAGRQALYGLEGKVEGRGTAHTGIYAGAVVMANFVGSACSALNYGARVLAKITTDGTNALAQGTNVGVYIDPLVGGLTKLGLWASDWLRTDSGIYSPNITPFAQSGTDQAGAGLIVAAGLGTGAGVDGGVLVRLAKPTTSGTTAHTAANAELWNYEAVAPETKSATLYSEHLAQWKRVALTEEMTLSTSGATTQSVGNLLPAGAVIQAVVVRVTEAITGAATAWNIGDPFTSARFIDTTTDVAEATTKVGIRHWDPTVATDTAKGPTQTAASTLTIWANGAATTGKIRVTVFAHQFIAPLS